MLETAKIIDLEAVQNAKAEQEDYYVDELLYCGKCHTPKQKEYNMGDRVLRPRILCKCEQEKKDREEQLEREEKRRQKIEDMRSKGFPESKMKYWTFAQDDKADEKLSTACAKYVQNFSQMKENGKGLLFYGNVGVGKSFYAAAITNALINLEIPCLMTTFTRLVNEINGQPFEEKQKFIDSLNNYELLVIDDLATERDTEYMNEVVYTIIDSRYRSGLPIIITTNLSGEEIKNSASIHKQRVFSRLLEMTIPIQVKGQDRRKQKLAEEYGQYKALLGL